VDELVELGRHHGVQMCRLLLIYEGIRPKYVAALGSAANQISLPIASIKNFTDAPSYRNLTWDINNAARKTDDLCIVMLSALGAESYDP
jgi:hypothetical protein